MKMDDMNKVLEKMGFNVDRHYVSEGMTYSFTVWKSGLGSLTSYFPYPKDESPITKDRLQKRFIEELSDTYIKRYEELRNGNINFLDKKMNIPKSTVYIPSIKKVIFNDPATIILWADGSKTVVKCDGEDYDPEKGMAMAIAKKALGNKGNYYNTFKKWLPDCPITLRECIDRLRQLSEKLIGKKDRNDKEDKT